MLKVDINKHIQLSSDVKSDVISDVKSDLSPDVVQTSFNTTTPNYHLIQIPQGIALSGLYNPYVKNKRRGSDVNAHLVSMFVLKNKYKRKPINSFIPLNSTVLRQMCGGDYSRYIKALLDNGLIEQYTAPYSYTMHNGKTIHCKGTYSTAFKQSKKYRLNIDPDTPLEDYVIRDKQVIAKINKARIEKLQRLLRNNPTAKQVYESIKLLSINKADAIKSIKDLYMFQDLKMYAKIFIREHSAKELKAFIKDVLHNKRNKRKLNKVLKAYGIKANHKPDGSDVTWSDVVLKAVNLYAKLKSRMHWIRVLDEIQKGNHSYISMSQDDRTNRIFNTLTLTPKNIREYIKLDGKQLIEFDASDCQWKLLIKLCNILCNPSYYEDLIKKYGINTTTNTQTTEHNKPLSLNMLHSFFGKHKDHVRKDCKKLEVYLEKGLLRPYIVQEYENQGKKITDGQAKGYLIKNVLFGNPEHGEYQNWTSVKAFRTLFPHIYQVLIKLKKYWVNEAAYGYKPLDVYGRSLKYKALPLILQKMETEIFIDGMKNVDAPFITLHDAIITNQDGAVKVKKALEKVIDKTNTNLKLKYTEI